ncbi:HNH endonuclease [Ohtaekwangia koreensis]|uniref:TIGR02646 family protein n=1 Tax=Ohtaekwangia koreensis TaxID=688867 RepID=A0A1T5ITT2_9BACT|nr:HNH endonuclease [Ohtaekwangia koreensis]SKC42492.1 TIGR02646 family protein [Ohtaekwangia koreensis]
MIKLTKSGEPAVLLANKTNWKSQLLHLIANNQPVPDSLYTRYNHDEVKDALRTECNSKCMYCESKVEHITDLHIEHIQPKAKTKFPELTFEYANLGLACPLCNRNKSDTYDPNNAFINPYIDSPDNHFYAWGVFLWPKDNDNRARLTELEIGLNRNELIEARAERIKALKGMIDSYKREANATIKEAIRKQIMKEVGDDKVYSFFCKMLVDSEI